jgi:hypothetical protein
MREHADPTAPPFTWNASPAKGGLDWLCAGCLSKPGGFEERWTDAMTRPVEQSRTPEPKDDPRLKRRALIYGISGPEVCSTRS